ncbi:DUF58 domain-containing protein [Candidatus Woesearchaeota archaeon]|nr:DUF58 domain-containing protein [Candidatus Woesearchaeota archaeon]
MIRTDFLKQLDKFELVIKKKITSSFVGERRSEFAGTGLIFRDYSNYSYGDDFRSIDWKAFARTDKLFVKRYEEDRNLTVHIIMDFSGSMDFGARIKKYEYASMIGLGFAHIALRNNERFVLTTFDDKLEFFKPKKGVGQIASMLNYLNNKKAVGVSSFENSLIKYKELINSRALVVIISDFFYDTGQIRNILHKYKKNKIVLVQVMDPLETKLDIEGDFDLVDLESDSRMHTFIDPYLRKKYFQELELHRGKIKDECVRIKADFHIVSSDENIFDVFYRILY